jgi:hypothetical protein
VAVVLLRYVEEEEEEEEEEQGCEGWAWLRSAVRIAVLWNDYCMRNVVLLAEQQNP